MALKRDTTPVVALHDICRRADTYTYVTVVDIEGAENPQAASWVEPVISPEAVVTKVEGVKVEIVLVGNVMGKALVSSGPLIAPT